VDRFRIGVPQCGSARIGVLWIVLRVLRRRRPAAVVDASYSTSSLCYCRRGLGRRDVLAWTAPQRPPTGKDHVGAAPGEAVVVNDAPTTPSYRQGSIYSD